MSADDGND